MKTPVKDLMLSLEQSINITNMLNEYGMDLDTLRQLISGKKEKVEEKPLTNKLIVYDNKECLFIEKSDIIYASANGAYTKISLLNGKQILISKNLKALTIKLDDERFIRPHKSYLVNTNQIAKYIKGDGGYLVMSNNDSVPVASRKRNDLHELVEKLAV